MDFYLLIMRVLSIFGLLILLLSLYMILLVPTKMSSLSRFALLAHAISAGTLQIYLTFGTIPTLLLPCFGGYPNGILTKLGMTTVDQFWSQLLLLAVTGFSVTLLSIVRTFAVSWNLSDRLKKTVLITLFIGSLIETLLFLILGLNLRNGGEEGRILCAKTFPVYVPSMYEDILIFFAKDTALISYLLNALFTVFIVSIPTLISVYILLQSLRYNSQNTVSSRFSVQQSKATSAVLHLLFIEIFGLFCPSALILVSVFSEVYIPYASPFIFISLGIYPVVGSLIILMANPTYAKKMRQIMNIFTFPILHKFFGVLVGMNITTIQTVSLRSRN